jgi:hypothetical protein
VGGWVGKVSKSNKKEKKKKPDGGREENKVPKKKKKTEKHPYLISLQFRSTQSNILN